jgi:hypothetical protein
MYSVVLPCVPAWPGTRISNIQDLILASDAVSGVSDGSAMGRPRKRSSPERKPIAPQLASGALTAMAQTAIEVIGLGALREMELVAVSLTAKYSPITTSRMH